jgi:hypothetical protein
MSVPAHGTTEPAVAYVDVQAADYERVRSQQLAATAQNVEPLPVDRPADPVGAHTEATIAEVDTELDEPAPDYPDGAVAVPLGGAGGRRDVIHVLASSDWPSRGNSAMQRGDFETWASLCLALDDYDTWLDLDPTLGQINTMLEEWGALTGQSLGKSPRSQRPLRRTGRR